MNIAGVQSGNGKVVICWVIVDCDTPSITCPSNITIMANPFACEVPVSYADPTVESDCVPTITRIAGPASGSLLDLGTSVVTFVASNPPANNDTCSFTITVLENGQGQPSNPRLNELQQDWPATIMSTSAWAATACGRLPQGMCW